MKYFFDTEFIEWSGGIDIVSLGIVSENGDTFYAESTNFDERNADQWVKDNVLSKLRWWGNEQSSKGYCNVSAHQPKHNQWAMEVFGPNTLIAKSVLDWIESCELTMDMKPGSRHITADPVFYSYYGAYDWVIFARLFGRLIDKPDSFPMWVRDLKQMMWERGLDTDWKRQNSPDPEGEHNALVDAHWNKDLHDLIIKQPVKP